MNEASHFGRIVLQVPYCEKYIAIFCSLPIRIGPNEAYYFAVDHNKIDLVNMDLNFQKSTLWVVF